MLPFFGTCLTFQVPDEANSKLLGCLFGIGGILISGGIIKMVYDIA